MIARMLATHLWQSTIVGLLAWMLTLVLRRDRAAARHLVWLAASVKFLVPFALLTSLGERVGWRPAVAATIVPRFGLKVHHESRVMEVYALVMAKPGVPGPALKPSSTDCAAVFKAGPRTSGPPSIPPSGIMPCNIVGNPGRIRFGGFPIAQLTTMLGIQSGRMVVDRTGLTGKWEFDLHFAPDPRDLPNNGESVAAADPDAPSLFTALQEQLGLKLEATKGPVDVFVIENVQRPTAD